MVNRERLVDILNVPERIVTPISIEDSIRIDVDKELARLFGAKVGFIKEVPNKRLFSLDDIKDILCKAGIDKGILSPEDYLQKN